jgi:hypothetical protein
MIRLKSLLEQSTITDKNKNNISSLPEVLFIGDSYTRSGASYAHKLIDNKVVSGRVIAWPKINIKQLVKLTRRYVSDKYSIISIMFGDIVKRNKVGIEEFRKQLIDLEQVAKLYGAQLVIVQNPNRSYEQYKDFLDAISDIDADVFVSPYGILSNANTQTSIYNDWVSAVISDLNIQIPNSKLELPDSTADNTNIVNQEITPSNTVSDNFSASVIDQAYNLILPFEGFTAVAEKDADGYCRIGHGSSHITKADGTVIDLGKPAPGKTCAETYPQYIITKDDAHRDLRRLIPHTFLPYVKRAVKELGGDISKFNDATVAVLVSVAYNYGHIPNELHAAIAASDMLAIGTALKTNFNAKRSNPIRRKKEGAYILRSLGKTDDQNEPDLWTKVKSHVFNRRANGGATIEYSSKAQKDLNDSLINPNLIDDLKKAADAAGVTIKIGTAKTGHSINTASGNRSRHADGLAVDIIEINGLNWNSKSHAEQIGAYAPAEAFAAELEKLGYTKNNEYGHDKAMLTFGFKNHDNHIHVSRKS